MHNSHLVLTYFTSSFPLTTENTSNNDHAPTKNNSNNILRFSNTNHHIHPNSTHNFGASSSSTSSSSTTAHTPFGPTGRGFGAGPSLSHLSTLSSPSGRSTKTVRKISRLPYKVLDAPGICDDYYLNLGQAQSIILSCIHCIYTLSSYLLYPMITTLIWVNLNPRAYSFIRIHSPMVYSFVII